MMLRTSLLASAVPAIALLAGCAESTTTTLQSDVQAIADAVSGVVAALQAAVPAIPTLTITALNAAVARVVSDAGQVSQALTPEQAIVVDFANAVNTVADLAQPYYRNAPAVGALMIAAGTLVQTVLEENGGAVGALVAAISLKAPAMSPAAARAVLRGK